jgi:hypothetical protein
MAAFLFLRTTDRRDRFSTLLARARLAFGRTAADRVRSLSKQN